MPPPSQKKSSKANYFPVDKSAAWLAEKTVIPLNPLKFVDSFNMLAIDPGTKNVAVAHIAFDGGARVVHTTKFEMPSELKEPIQRLAYLHLAIGLWVGESNFGRPNIVAKETVAHHSLYGVAEAGRLQHMIEEIALGLGCPFINVGPAQMRSFLGSKSKSDTQMQIYKRFGREFSSEDECDAYAIGETAIAMLHGTYAPKKGKRRAANDE